MGTIINVLCGIITIISICVSIYYGRKSRKSDKFLEGATTKISEYQQEISEYHSKLNRLQKEHTILKREELDTAKIKHRNSISPRLWTNGGMINQMRNTFSMNLNNAGEFASIIDIKDMSNNIRLVSNRFPISFNKGDSLNFGFSYIGERDISNALLEFTIYYQDQERNTYSVKIKGQPGRYKEESPCFIQS